MKNIRSILVPTDFSNIALTAFTYALQLADALDASVDVMYAMPVANENPGYGALVSTLPPFVHQRAQSEISEFVHQGLEAVVDRLRNAPRVETFVHVGDLRYSVRTHVEREGNQLIVMGTGGRHSGWDDLLGTNASFLVKKAPCPVLIIPEHTEYRPPESLCFSTDLSDVATLQAGKLLHALRPFRPRIDFLHVRQEKKEASYDLDLLRQLFNRPGAEPTATFAERSGEDVVTEILAYAREKESDWIVMHRPERPWFESLLHKSSTVEATRTAQLPLLIVTARDLNVREEASSAAVDRA